MCIPCESVSVAGKLTIGYMVLHDNKVMKKTTYTSDISDNVENFSVDDLKKMNDAKKLYKEMGCLPEPDCDRCESRFLCWTNRDDNND